MEEFKNYKLRDTTWKTRFRDTSKERKMIIYCKECKIGYIAFEASTVYWCTNCKKTQDYKILDKTQ